MAAPRSAIVVGAGGHARAVIGVLQEPGNATLFRVVAVLDTAPPRAAGEAILGVPIQSGQPERLDEIAVAEHAVVFVAIGNNAIRAKHFEQCRTKGYALPNLISTFAMVAPSAILGCANFIAPFAHIGPQATLGDNNLINTQANIEHESRVGSHTHVAPGSVILGRAVIGNRCHVGSRAVVLENLSVADGTVLGAGAVLTRSSLDGGCTMVGVPARAIR